MPIALLPNLCFFAVPIRTEGHAPGCAPFALLPNLCFFAVPIRTEGHAPGCAAEARMLRDAP